MIENLLSSPSPFPKSCRILRSHDFRAVGRYGERRVGKFLVIELLSWRNPRRPTQLGLTVSKKFGDAVRRNRFKRLVREVFRKNRGNLAGAQGLVISPRSCAKECSYQELEADFLELISRPSSRGRTPPEGAATTRPQSRGESPLLSS